MKSVKRQHFFTGAPLAAALAVAACVALAAGSARATFDNDAASQDPVTGAWVLPSAYYCVAPDLVGGVEWDPVGVCTGDGLTACRTNTDCSVATGTCDFSGVCGAVPNAVKRTDLTPAGSTTSSVSPPACNVNSNEKSAVRACLTTELACTAKGYRFSSYSGSCSANAWTTDDPDFGTGLSMTGLQWYTGNNGCLRCHNEEYMATHDPVAAKEDYLDAGHRNMLRKVTPGTPQIDPTGAPYAQVNIGTTAAVDWMTAMVNSKLLYWIYDGWMGDGPWTPRGTVDGTSYSCGRCHATGWSSDLAINMSKEPEVSYPGLTNDCVKHCKIDTATVCTSNAQCPGVGDSCILPPVGVCTAGGVGAYTYDGISFAADTNQYSSWDRFGIQCARCHVATDNGHATFPEGGVSTGGDKTAMCAACHRQEKGGVPENMDSPGTKLAVGFSHGAFGFDSHGPVYQYLNSPHGLFTGTWDEIGCSPLSIVPAPVPGVCALDTTVQCSADVDCAVPGGVCNKVGYCENDNTIACTPETEAADCGAGNSCFELCDSSMAKYASHFKYMPDPSTITPSPAGKSGGCTVCHDVHKDPDTLPRFPGDRPGVESCVSCHDGQGTYNATTGVTTVNAGFKHPEGTGTPLDDENPCAVCHMPGGQHLFRINVDPSYSTMPASLGHCAIDTATACTSNSACPGAGDSCVLTGLANTAPEGSYTQAVWNDLDMACGQCHGGSAGAGAVTNNAPYISKADLAELAEDIHNNLPSVNFSYSLGSPNTLNVMVFAAASCSNGPCDVYAWDWGDGTTGSGPSTAHTYATGGAKVITLTVTQYGTGSTTVTKTVNVYTPDLGPTVGGTDCGSILSTDDWSASLTDSSTDDNAVSKVTVTWGDGSLLAMGGAGTVFTHTYRGPGTYRLVQKALDTIGQQSTRTCFVTVSYFTIGGTVNENDGTTPVASAKVTVTNNTTNLVAKTVYTAGDGSFSAGSLRPDSYTLTVTASGFTFPATGPITVGPSDNTIVINANP